MLISENTTFWGHKKLIEMGYWEISERTSRRTYAIYLDQKNKPYKANRATIVRLMGSDGQ